VRNTSPCNMLQDDLDKTAAHAVLVWIHGGSFLAGSGDTGIDKEIVANNLIFRDVVLVTVNYRLGPLGLLFVGL
jgi:para-nitrobenzyl esterase